MPDLSAVMNDNQDIQLNQQTVLARFGEFALKCDDLDAILHEACRLVGDALGTQLAKVVELQPDRRTMLVRAGVGWKPGVVGQVTTTLGMLTPESHALETGEPVISPDISAEDRLEYPDFIIKHGVQALATVLIVGTGDKPAFGVLQVDSRAPRAFTNADIQFLRSYANLLASAVERLRIHQELRDRAEEKERLLRELQHRVKNNLQTVMNLVSLRVRRARTSEAAQELRAVGDGIEALRLVHDKIYSANAGMDRTCLGTYLGELTASLLRFHGKDVSTKVRLVADVERLEVHPDCAVPLGLVTSEFVTNSLKYAFGNGRGVIGVRVERAEPETACVTLWDDGRGLPVDHSGGTGLSLIEGLVQQVKGTSQWDRTQGTRLVITVPVPSGFSS
jgi:two-component sensor histidine kinase